MAKTLENLLGEFVCRQNGEKVPVSSLCGKDTVIGIYFSAHWCPPCRGFTPKLVEFYNKKRKDTDRVNKFEIVFVSWDKDEASYKEYFGSMPWLAMPFDLNKKGKLAKKFKIQGIPKLVLMDGETGNKITCDGYSCLTDDENGVEFPWRPKKFCDVINGKLIRNNKEEVDALDELRGKYVGVYFSAHWCPPCRAFTPELIQTYEKLKSNGQKFEVVFVTSDRSEESFQQYFDTMPWLAIPFQDPRLAALKNLFGINGIPTLVVVDDTGSVVTLDGRLAVSIDREGQEFPWHPKPLNELTEEAAVQLNESACLVLFVDGEDDAEIDKAKDVLMESAKEEHHKGDDQELFFFFGADDEICDRVREFASLGEEVPLLVILDFPEQKVYTHKAEEFTKEVVKGFVSGYFKGTIESRPLKR